MDLPVYTCGDAVYYLLEAIRLLAEENHALTKRGDLPLTTIPQLKDGGGSQTNGPEHYELVLQTSTPDKEYRYLITLTPM